MDPDAYLASVRARSHRAQSFRSRCRRVDAVRLNQVRKYLQLTWPQFWRYVALELDKKVRGAA